MRYALVGLAIALAAPASASADEAEDLRYALTRLGATVESVRCDWASTEPAIPCRAHYRYISRTRRAWAKRARRITTLWCFSVYRVGYNTTPVELPPGVEQIAPMTVMQETFKRCHLPRREHYRSGVSSRRWRK